MGLLAAAVAAQPSRLLLCDAFPGARYAYSTRLLSRAYTGPCLRLRRPSDSAEQDIYFDANGEIDSVAITSFLGVATGLVSVLYNQAGSANATQTNPSVQPSYSAASKSIAGSSTAFMQASSSDGSGAFSFYGAFVQPFIGTFPTFVSFPNTLQIIRIRFSNGVWESPNVGGLTTVPRVGNAKSAVSWRGQPNSTSGAKLNVNGVTWVGNTEVFGIRSNPQFMNAWAGNFWEILGWNEIHDDITSELIRADLKRIYTTTDV